ncbi:type III-A CRISPR-associated RAMP protein Csm4 [Ligilactobacillus ruminis]|uniref:CRISPR system Cms protein Csm4 n=2 Tax=Ligilactobacillus ruminis TaxID=1623 RepID=A0A837INB8_9LACO|nr:type III-A CRISPR-associated RAMP protein Csm4 [Ligilactobacillus ruminis]KLA44795.1 CRISPR-associated protein, Csm4 family [Ligilactobacillus ruminis]SFG15585.1 CRISPR-associated protein Csm4 [Ligilactobacillus ruminis DSM 20403 = NBRC 102161]
MTFKIYRMSFQRAHFGKGYLDTSDMLFDASRLYSALCLEAIKNDCLNEFTELAESDGFFLSDAFPHVGEPYFPKPVCYPKKRMVRLEGLKEDNEKNKLTDRIVAVPMSEMSAFIRGEADYSVLFEDQEGFCRSSIVVRKGEDPYEVGVTTFSQDVYVLATQSELLDELMTSLQYSGLGGKRSSGYGRFDLAIEELPEGLEEMLNTDGNEQMLLTTALPQDAELHQAMTGARYDLKKSSGFAYSETAGQLVRKQDLYKFRAGSVFVNKFKGKIADVRPDGYPHPVYNFAKGLFLDLKGVRENEGLSY